MMILKMQARAKPEAHVSTRWTETWLSPPLSPLDSQSRILGYSHTWCGEVNQASSWQLWWGVRIRSGGRPLGEAQPCSESSEFRWRRDSSLHTLHGGGGGGGVTCHPRSWLKNASSPACQRWFPSDPHAGTSERFPVGSTSADLRRDVCGAGEALLENFPWLPHLLFRGTWIHLNPVLAV